MSKAGVTISIPASEIASFKSWLNQQNEEVKREGKSIVMGTIMNIRRMAVQFAPGDVMTSVAKGKRGTGFLRSGIQFHIDRDGLGGGVYAMENRKYAPYQEFGTGNKFNMTYASNVKQKWGIDSAQWKGQGIRKVNVRANPYLFAAANIGYDRMIQKLKAIGFKEK